MGEKTIIIKFEDILSSEVNKRVRTLSQTITESNISGIERLIPAFNSLAVCYNPRIIKFRDLVDKLKALEDSMDNSRDIYSKDIYIPVVFGGKYGPDLEDVAERTDLSPKEVVGIIQSKPYLVYMVGFIAGFPYCGDLDERLILPRRSNPRIKIPKGSIAIANEQIGLYTISSPGGWHIIGWSPMESFNPFHEPPSIVHAGDYVKFVQISPEQADVWDEHRQREWDLKWNSRR